MSCVSQIQLEANRENAKRSTGPRSEEGKAKSSRNAVKFGIFSEQVVLPGEDASVYESFRDGMYARLKPADELERMLADRVVLAAWKLRRVQAAEAARYAELRKLSSEWARVDGKLVSVPPPTGQVIGRSHQTFERFAKYEAALERSMYRAIAELRKAQAERGDDAVEDAEPVDEPPRKNEPISSADAPANEAVCKIEPVSEVSEPADAPAEQRVCKIEPIFPGSAPRQAPTESQDVIKPST